MFYELNSLYLKLSLQLSSINKNIIFHTVYTVQVGIVHCTMYIVQYICVGTCLRWCTGTTVYNITELVHV